MTQMMEIIVVFLLWLERIRMTRIQILRKWTIIVNQYKTKANFQHLWRLKKMIDVDDENYFTVTTVKENNKYFNIVYIEEANNSFKYAQYVSNFSVSFTAFDSMIDETDKDNGTFYTMLD